MAGARCLKPDVQRHQVPAESLDGVDPPRVQVRLGAGTVRPAEVDPDRLPDLARALVPSLGRTVVGDEEVVLLVEPGSAEASRATFPHVLELDHRERCTIHLHGRRERPVTVRADERQNLPGVLGSHASVVG